MEKLAFDYFEKQGVPESRLTYNDNGVYVFTAYPYDIVKKQNFIRIIGDPIPEDITDFFTSLKIAHGEYKGDFLVGEKVN